MYNIPNLEKLRRWLCANRERAEGHINMAHWFEGTVSANIGVVEGVTETLFREHTYGTTCCIAGWAAVSSEFDAVTEGDHDVPMCNFVAANFLAGGEFNDPAFDWVFGDGWNNNFDDAITRINYAIGNNEYPDLSEWNCGAYGEWDE